MLRRAATALTVLALLVRAAPAEALGAEKPWFGGVYSAFRGFSAGAGLPAAEFLALGLFAEPLATRALNPALCCGLLLPFSPSVRGAAHLHVALDLTLVDIPANVLKRRFYLSSCWSPSLGVECLVPLDSAAVCLALDAAPLRARLGDGTFTVGSLQLILDRDGGLRGWGLTLFKACLFLF